jgi:hypothetical protein
VTDHADTPDPGAAEGNNYLRLVEPTASAQPAAFARFAGPSAGQSVHYETGAYVGGGMLMKDSDWVNGGILYVRAYADGTVKYSPNDGESGLTTASITCDPDKWQKWTVDFTAGGTGGTQITLGIDGSTTSFTANGNWLPNGIQFWGPETSAVSTFCLDGSPVPEPGAMMLLATGVLSLLAYAWRKRK